MSKLTKTQTNKYFMLFGDEKKNYTDRWGTLGNMYVSGHISHMNAIRILMVFVAANYLELKQPCSQIYACYVRVKQPRN